MPIVDDQVPSADEVLNAIGANFNDIAQNIFNADYIGFSSKLHNTGVPNLKNVFYSTFQVDDADTVYQFNYDATNDLYVIPDLSVIGTEYVIIEATSYNETWTGGTNDTYVLPISSGKWLVYCDTGTDAVHRAQINKSLWYGTTGTDQLILDFTSVTAVKTSHSNDVGKRAHYSSITNEGSTGTYTGTFVNTSTNTNCSSWSLCHTDSGASTARWEIPSGSTKNSASGTPSTSDELGTDTSSDEVNNPADCQLESISGINTITVNAIILCSGDITWGQGGVPGSTSNIDFFTDNSIPDMTAADTLTNEGIGTSTLIFKDTVLSTDNAIPVINSTIDATSSEQISVSANSGGAYVDVNNTEIARPTAGTGLWRRIVITRTDLSKEDIVTEQAVKHSFY